MIEDYRPNSQYSAAAMLSRAGCQNITPISGDRSQLRVAPA